MRSVVYFRAYATMWLVSSGVYAPRKIDQMVLKSLQVTFLWTFLMIQTVLGFNLRVLRLQMANEDGAAMNGYELPTLFGSGSFGGGRSHFCALQKGTATIFCDISILWDNKCSVHTVCGFV